MSCVPFSLVTTAKVNSSPLLVFKVANERKLRPTTSRRTNYYCSVKFSGGSASWINDVPNLSESVREEVQKMVAKRAAIFMERHKEFTANLKTTQSPLMIGDYKVDEAYARCGDLMHNEHGKLAYLATFLSTPKQRRAFWAVRAWLRTVDDVFDEPNASTKIDEWETRLTDIFQGHPHDIYDAALCDTISKCRVDIQPFKELITGMKMDLNKTRYHKFDELFLYCCLVDGAIVSMFFSLVDLQLESESYIHRLFEAATLSLIAGQLIDILIDVKDDAGIGRIYMPQDELAHAGLSDEDILTGVIHNRWKHFMKGQIIRIRMLLDEAEMIFKSINSINRFPLFEYFIISRQMLNAIEASDYDVFTKKVELTGKTKLASFARASSQRLWSYVESLTDFPSQFKI